jgi:hypothetical protein
MKSRLIFLDILYILIVLFLIFLSIFESGTVYFGAPIVLALIGFALVWSNRLKKISLVEKVLYWVSVNIFVPKTSYNHLIWGLFLILVAFLTGILGPQHQLGPGELASDRPGTSPYPSWWYKDPIFWIILLLIVAFGLYRSRTRK